MTTEVETKIGISEIFLSIQGEGLYTGEPTIFVRFQGCTLGCIWCDSKYTWKPKTKNQLTSEEILQEIIKLDKTTNTSTNWVCITGGEPLQQPNGFSELVNRLKGLYKIEVETSGLVEVPKGELFRTVDSWVVDLKCPSSGVIEEPKVEDYKYLGPQDQLKVIIGSNEDIIYAYRILNSFPTEAKVLISPMFKNNGTVDKVLLQTCADFCISNNYRLSLQTHKYIWGMKRGV